MFKGLNVIRDFLFAAALIALIRIAYEHHQKQAEIRVELPKEMKTFSSTNLLAKTKQMLDDAYHKAYIRRDQTLIKKLDIIRTKWAQINRKHQEKIKQEDALTYILGPIFSLSKATKKHLLKKDLQQLKAQLNELLQSAHTSPGNNSLSTATGRL